MADIRDDIKAILENYGCLEWANGGDAEEMAPYLQKMLDEIERVCRSQVHGELCRVWYWNPDNGIGGHSEDRGLYTRTAAERLIEENDAKGLYYRGSLRAVPVEVNV